MRVTARKGFEKAGLTHRKGFRGPSAYDIYIWTTSRASYKSSSWKIINASTNVLSLLRAVALCCCGALGASLSSILIMPWGL